MLPLQHPAEYRESAAETALSQRKEKRGIFAAGHPPLGLITADITRPEWLQLRPHWALVFSQVPALRSV